MIFAWSAGGIDYTQTIVDKLCLTKYIIVLEKSKQYQMDIVFDDMNVKLGNSQM